MQVLVTNRTIGSYSVHMFNRVNIIHFVNFICRKGITARRLVCCDLLPTFVPWLKRTKAANTNCEVLSEYYSRISLRDREHTRAIPY